MNNEDIGVDSFEISDGRIVGFQYPEGWYMRVGQVYSNPHTPFHVKITGFARRGKDDIRDVTVYYEMVTPDDHHADVNDQIKLATKARAFNEGGWDLEHEVVIEWIVELEGESVDQRRFARINCDEAVRDNESDYIVYADDVRIRFDSRVIRIYGGY